MFVCSQWRGVGPRRQRLDSLYWYCCKGVSEIQIKFSINWYLSQDIYRPKTRRGGIGCPAPKIHINYLQLVKTLTWHLTLLQSKLSAMIMTYKSLWYVEYIFKVLEFSLQMIRCLAPLNTGLWSMLKTWCHSQKCSPHHIYKHLKMISIQCSRFLFSLFHLICWGLSIKTLQVFITRWNQWEGEKR